MGRKDGMGQRTYLWLLALAVFFLVLFNLPEQVGAPVRSVLREGLAPYQMVVSRGLRNVGTWADAARRMRAGAEERRMLTDRIAFLEGEVRRLESLDEQNRELRRLLGLARRLEHSAVAAEVIAREDGCGWWQTVRINKGRAHGITEHLAVIAAGGLVGKTKNVSAETSEVLLIADRDCRVSVRVERSGAFGVLRGGRAPGSPSGPLDLVVRMPALTMDFLDRSADVRVGDRIVTSGLGGVFPADLAVGEIRSLTEHPSGLYAMAEVTPAAALDRLRWVLVLLK